MIESGRLQGRDFGATELEQVSQLLATHPDWSRWRLIGALVAFGWHGHLQAASWARHRAELSFGQVSAQLQARGLSLAEALIAGGRSLRALLWQLWHHLLWTTRKGRQRTRQTTWQALQENWLALTSP